MWEPFLQFVLPPILGGVAGFAASWLNWDVEKRRHRQTRRGKLIDDWRAAISNSRDEEQFVATTEYASLRPHLSESLVRRLEPPACTIVLSAGPGHWRRALLERVGELESEWKLV